MSEMQTFTDVEFGNVRMIWEDGKPLFCGNDVARALGYAVPKDAVSAHTKGAVKRRALTDGGEQEMAFIPEGDVYRLISRSNLPAAERFEKWVFDEVLPSIHKHDIYAAPETIEAMLLNPDSIIKIAQALKNEKEARETAQRLLEETSIQLDESKEWYTVKRVAALNKIPWKNLKYKLLISASERMGYPVKKVFDANYDKVNAYHINVWMQEYSTLIYKPDPANHGA